MLALLPIEGRELCPGEPRLDGGLEGRLLLQPYRESELVDPDAEPAAKLAEGTQLVELEQAVLPVTARAASRDHETRALEDTTILEVSTPELDDVVRLEDRYGRKGTSEP